MSPENGSEVTFISCTQSEYDSLQKKDPNAVYFCKGSGRLFIGDEEYVRPNIVEYVDSAIKKAVGDKMKASY